MNRRRTRLWGWVGALVIGGSALVYGAVDDPGPVTNADRAYALAKDFACPVCLGQSVAESDVAVARNIRRQIRVWVDEGRTDEYIRDQLVSFYGDDIDYTPPASGVSGLVWILPVVAGAGAVTGLVLAFRRWRDQPTPEVDEADIALVDEARRRR
ncbi:MAG: cytochrome c-type biogenesis protein CcmH [Actinomyces sp.]|nr:MAG: cytochrome c-type biogenesis protein CcmH [Actinomyces sp.]